MKTTADDRSTPPRRPTILDVAAAAGVSAATVSNALTGKRAVDPDTRARVEQAVRAVGYTLNLRARNLRTGRADTIAIFSSMPVAVAGGRARMGFAMEIAASAASRALEKGFALILVPPLVNGPSPFHDMHLDGALVIEPQSDDPDIALLLGRGVPVVSIGRQLGRDVVPFVDLQPYATARLLIEHLCRTPDDRIALIVGAQPRHTHQQTEQAYRDAARARGQRAIVRRIDEAGGAETAHAITRQLLLEHPRVNVLLVSVDAFAVGARAAAVELGLDVPGQLRLATRYDGNFARECDPPLTAVNLHLDEVAALGVDLLFERIAHQPGRASAMGPLPSLIARRSSADAPLPGPPTR